MVAVRRCNVILCVFLLLLASALRSEADRKVLETLAVVDLAVDQVLIGCSKENITKEEDTHCESCLSSKILLKNRNLQEAIFDLPPQAKRTLLDCLRKHHARHSWTWFSSKFSEFLFFRPIVSKSYIVCNPHASNSKNLELFRARRLGDGHRARAPAPAPPRHKKRNSQKHVAIISTITAVAVIILSPIVYLCCLRGDSSKVNNRSGQRDRQTRLNACSYDISAGSSSETSHGLGNPFYNDSRVSEMIGGHGTSVAFSQSAESVVCGTGKLLPLPPGRIAQLPPPAPPSPIKPPAPAPPPPPPSRPGKVTKPSPNRGQSSSGVGSSDDPDSQKAKLKPFFWDKVMADPDSSMVWHELRDGSFQVDEEMMETLFGYAPEKGKGNRMKELSSSESPIQYIQIIDAKKSQNLAILLKALNVSTEEVCNALNEGNELPGELVHTLLKMAPTSDEELKLRLFNGNITHLGPAERFLKVMVDIPFAFKRLESLSFVSSLQEDVSSMKETFSILEAASLELKNNRLFLKLLEAVLKTGNRMNDGTYRGGAEAFKLDTLLKLSDVKGADGKTTLLHFVVHEIIRSEGVRSAREKRTSISSARTEEENSTVDVDHQIDSSSSTTTAAATATEYYRGLGLEVVSGLSNDLVNVTKAAAIDGDNISATVSKLIQSLSKTQSFIRCELASLEKENEFRKTLENFAENAEEDIRWVEEEEKRIRNVVKETVDYFHGGSGKEDGLRLFVTVRDFLVILEKVCKEVKSSSSSSSCTATMLKQTPQKTSIHSEPCSPDSHHSNDVLIAHVRPRLFPHGGGSSSDHDDHEDEDEDHHDEDEGDHDHDHDENEDDKLSVRRTNLNTLDSDHQS